MVNQSKKRLFGLIGCPLTHSFSANYFNDKFLRENIIDAEYRNFPISNIAEFNKLIVSNENLLGLNVTIPYKETIIPLLDELDEIATNVGAVNCVKIIRETNRIYSKGFNTDVIGFKKSLISKLTAYHTQALILGSGGASKAIAYLLDSLKIDYKIVSRQNIVGALKYSELTNKIIEKYKLIINTTPVGMFPNTDEVIRISYNGVTSNHLLFDLIYNPSETVFLKKGRERGAEILNGRAMLQHQAEAAWEIFG